MRIHMGDRYEAVIRSEISRGLIALIAIGFVCGCGTTEAATYLPVSLRFSGAINGEMTSTLPALPTGISPPVGFPYRDRTECADGDAGAAFGDGRSSEPILHSVVILGYINDKQLVSLHISYTPRVTTTAVERAIDLTAEEVMVEANIAGYGKVGAAYSNDVDYRTKLSLSADRRSGTIDVWLDTFETPRSRWINLSGTWRCA
ncbi:hypothetical protein ACGFQG_33085 [Nocardia fluminea]|uniref:hypothetical protein n=1 Tax=Nocardia fluminea TaxID=134984 RepID=UPI0037224132